MTGLENRIESVDRERAVVNSALWAAAGDAVGWITELGSSQTVKARTGLTRVSQPVAWKRRIGGRGGVHLELPAGTYSDDTQLRLAVCRSIRGNGTFDPEAFATIELTTWLGYALGAGKGTKAAAANLAKRGVNWFSNFFETKDQSYFHAGGNGAAMRIQPHVWVSRGSDGSFVLPVLRNSIITHGHVHGFCGAVFHALAVEEAIRTLRVPGIGEWRNYVQFLSEVPRIILEDRHLEAFWLPSWSKGSGQTLENAVEQFQIEAERDLQKIQPLLVLGPQSYTSILTSLGCFEPARRGSGWKTSLAASVLSWLFQKAPVEEALVHAANAIDSDTDTIATMAGAILGATSLDGPNWPIQDSAYIEREARRLSAIARGELRDSFTYPDPAKWLPPSSHSDAILLHNDQLALVGLGPAIPISEEYEAGPFVWQWMRLQFGQTVLGKRKKSLKKIQSSQLPGDRLQATKTAPTHHIRSMQLPFEGGGQNSGPQRSPEKRVPRSNTPPSRPPDTIGARARGDPPNSSESSLDALTDAVIRSDFDNLTLGKTLNKYIDDNSSIEGAAAFAGIVAKAKIARRRRMGR